jgi:hypothetical protein
MLGKRHARLLLPIDHQIIEAVGFTEAEYLEYLQLQEQLSRTRPAGPVALFGIDDAILIGIAINAALTAAAYLLTPRLKSSPGSPGQLRQNDQRGLRLVDRTEFAPKAGISSSQDVVELGSTVPVVWANRETIDGVTYGGVRVNCPLLWSQMVSLGGSQMLRAVYLLGEAPITGVDPTQFAFGENLLSSYDLGSAGDASARVTIYHRPNGGRIRATDRIAGRLAANDPGNAEANGAADVFQVRGLNNEWVSATCYSYSPSSQTTFGLYAPIGNGLPFRINPVMRSARLLSTVQAPTRSQREDGYSMVECSPDHAALVQRQKNDAISNGLGGLVALRRSGSTITTAPADAPQSLLVGDEIDYVLDNSTSANSTFTSRNYSEPKGDIATAVAGRQRQWDDSIIVGETYRIGSAVAVCKSRTPSDDVFRSDVQSQPVGGGVAITATFAVVTGGSVDFPTTAPPDPYSKRCGSSKPQIMRMARATIAVPQPAQVIEIGGKSTVGIRVNGFCNLRDSPSYSQIDLNACDIFDKDLLAPNQTLQTTSFQSGTITQIETRYTFWRLRYRIAGSSASWSQFPQLMGVAGSTQQQQYWFNRIEFPSRQRWELEYQPVSGWEIRSGTATGDLVVIDARLSSLLTLSDGTAVVRVPGKYVSRQQSTFEMPCATPAAGSLGIPYVDDASIVDGWGRLAEQFVYEEFSASTSSPEHEIVYVNVIDNAPTTPSYDNLALVAVNIRSGSEATTLGQFSAYVNQAMAASHSFPDLLAAGLTNERYGVGSILSPLQVGTASFVAAATWTRNRRYFWDGTLPKPVNFRQWGNDTAALFLLDLVTRNGVSYLQSAVLFDEAEQITGIFNSGNIVEESFKLSYFPQQDRQRIRVSVKWREERAAVGDGSNRGLFPVIREVTVREAGTSATAPIELIDMSDFCTSERHAIDVAKLKCRLKRLSTHQVDLTTIPQQATLVPGRCFRLAMETVSYAKPRNGAILADGTVMASNDIADGSYSVLLWDGTNQIQETTLTISSGKAVGQGQAVFTIAELAATEQTYKVQSMGFNEDGNINVAALHWPTDASGYSAVSAGWDVTGNWTIEGAIGSTDAPGTITPSFSGVTIVGASSLTVGVPSSYSAVVSGTGTGYTYAWSGAGLTFGSATSAVTTITATSIGAKTASCAVTRGGVTITGTQAIAALSATGTTTIGTVTISGATTGTGAPSSIYSAAISGTATDLVYSWSAPVVPASRAVTFSATNAQTPTIAFSGTGTYTLQCRVSSFSATDRAVDLPVTFSITTDTATATAHGLLADDEVIFTTTTGTLPTGLAERTAYYVRSAGLTANAFTVATTPGGTAIDMTGTATGSYRVSRLGKTDLHTVVVS